MNTSTNEGVIADPLFVGITRPAMALGVTYGAALANGMVTVELFLLTRNLLALLVCLPIHGVLWILCAVEPRFFELVLLNLRARRGTRASRMTWRATTYAPAPLRRVTPRSRGRSSNRTVAVYSAGPA